jgi:nucleotide-binding universal stress UspA family protein
MGTSMMLAETLAVITEHAKDRTSKARARFEEFCHNHNIARRESPAAASAVSAVWREMPAADEFDCLIAEARFHDAVVVAGGPDRVGRLPEGALGSVVISSGRPVLIAPEQASMKPIRSIAFAWKTSPESARAMTAAMPLLAKADRIEILTANEDDAQAKSCVDCTDRVVQQLRWHGLNAHGRFVIPAGRPVADAIVETARENGAELLIMGAYGHARLRELVFGGFTQRILRGADIPVLLFH